MDALTPRRVAPTDPRVADLILGHLDLMRRSSPAFSVHAMEAADLADAGAWFYAILDEDAAVAMGALKRIGPGQGELKSMHVRADRRGGGLADAILDALMAKAREEGMGRLFLETGSQDAFAPARAFYARHGFEACGPFEGYEADPNSAFMTRELASVGL